MFLGKNKISISARSSDATENGQINAPVNKTPNLLNPDEKKRADSFLTQPQYGKTLNVPNSNVLQVLPIITPAAPITPPRPAIMTTPKSSTANAKPPTTEIRPLLLVTATNTQQQPQDCNSAQWSPFASEWTIGNYCTDETTSTTSSIDDE